MEGAKAFCISLDEKALAAFDLFLRELLKWNEKINLTAIRTEKGIIIKHFLDSLSVFPHLTKNFSLLDIGSGAGFPGIPLKIVEPSFEITLIDSVLKKVDFQRHIIRRLGLRGIEASHGRVEDKQVLERLEGRFDIVLSRAFSDLQTLLRVSYPLLKKRGFVLAMKGKVSGEEIYTILEKGSLRYQFQKTVTFPLPSTSFKRTILLFEKQ